MKQFVGRKLYIRTVTYHLVGLVESVEEGIITLSGASWVAESDRFSVTIERGSLREVEYVGDAYVMVQAVTDFFPWAHELPTTK